MIACIRTKLYRIIDRYGQPRISLEEIEIESFEDANDAVGYQDYSKSLSCARLSTCGYFLISEDIVDNDRSH